MEPYCWNYDYSRTLWMKMFLAEPDFPKNRSDVRITFAQALEIIKTMDNLTQGIPKIVYLVGWQGLGHDDCYPEMEIVNEALKRPEDKTARDSLRWLFEEAGKYHTVVSFHGNLADAYTQTPCFPELVKANAVVKNAQGEATPIEIFNGRDGYKISYKGYYESGLFRRNWDRFCEATLVREAGTVHLDNFCIAQSINPYTSVEEEDEARNKMLDYIQSLGIDVTTEYTYRELEWRADSPGHPIRRFYETAASPLPEGRWEDAPLRTLGRIPASWWTSNLTAEECMRIPPALYSGHLTDPKLLAVFYGAMHGEDIWMKHGVKTGDWADEFLFQFCTLQLPYFYLNRLERRELQTDGDSYTVVFSDGVVSEGKNRRILKNGVILKDGDDALLPLDEARTAFIAYSKDGKRGEWAIPDAAFSRAAVWEITPDGNMPAGKAQIRNGVVRQSVRPGQALLLKAAEN
ncbi:MAG: hypothetical protein IJK89_12070 [Clostridia bacterium]|nr:hypothetical protein [Clostridia bacterium]